MSNIKPVKPLTPFKLCVLNNFPFIDETFDALTNYELLCKVVEYCNKTGENTNIANENVELLNNSFEELKTYVEETLDNLNVQELVDNKIDEMILNGEFQTIIINAINSVAPEALKITNTIRILSFDAPFFATASPYLFVQNNLLNTNNKNVLINFLNTMITENKSVGYFKNSNDINVIYYAIYINRSNDVITGVQIAPIFDMDNLNININDIYSAYIDLSVTLTDSVITDLSYSSETTKSYKILKNGNTNAYTPVNDYDPATKKFVLDNAGGGSSDQPIYFLEFTDYGTTLGCSQYAGVSFANTDWEKIKTALNDAHSKNYSDILLAIKLASNNNYDLFECHIESFDNTSNSTIISLIQELNSANYQNILMYGSNNEGLNYTSLGFAVSVTNGLIDSFLYQTSSTSSYRTFPVAENVLPRDLSTSITLNNNFQAYGVEGVKLLKQGNMFNLHGTIIAPNGSNWSSAKIDLNADCAPIPFESGVGYTACYTTCVLIKAVDSSIHYLFSNYVHVADAELGSISFSPVDTTLTIDANDLIRFNITYIRVPQ